MSIYNSHSIEVKDEKRWQCGYVKKNVIATYAYIYFYGNIEFFNSLIKLAKSYKKGASNNG
jgi:cobyrinic acid a,c-diamide synthase